MTKRLTPITIGGAPAGRPTWLRQMVAAAPLPPAGRNVQLDTVRGIACFLLVAYHAIGTNAFGGLKFPASSPIHDINFVIGYLRMPLFTFISGYVYSRAPVQWAKIGMFLPKKVMRLLIPMVVVGLLFFLLRSYAPGVNDRGSPDDIWLILFYPYAHYWYIQALMVIFVIIAVLESAGLLRIFARAFAVLVVATLVFDLRNLFPEFFSISRGLYLLPFFMGGVILARFGDDFLRGVVLPLVWLFIYMGLALAFGRQHEIDSGMMLLAGAVTSILLMRTVPAIGWVAFIGFYSYTIYLYHTFGYSAARIVMQAAGVDNRAVLLPIVVGAGLVLPIILHVVVARVPLVSRMLLGTRPSNPSGRFNADRTEPVRTAPAGDKPGGASI